MESIDLLPTLCRQASDAQSQLSLSKKISSSALIIWSIIRMRMVGASAMFLLRLFSATPPSPPPTPPPLCFPPERNLLSKADLVDRGSEGRVEAQTAMTFRFTSPTQPAQPIPPSLYCRARSARFLSPSEMENSQVLLEPKCILTASCRSGANLLIFW